MSNLEPNPREGEGGRVALAGEPVRELLTGREVTLNTRDTVVTRTLPNTDVRMVGAWCFLDHYGYDGVPPLRLMRVPPHPHTGLQTVTWLLEGDVLHRDSLGSVQRIRPGQLNLMTAGRGIAHSEESLPGPHPPLHGVQLWIAQPEDARHGEPAFEHHPRLPVLALDGGAATVLVGALGDVVSPATAFTPLVGAEVALDSGAEIRLPLRPDFEHAVQALVGTPEVDGAAVPPGALLYLGSGRRDLAVRAGWPVRLLLLGGEPFAERIVMWWNFVARGHDEIVDARERWMSGDGVPGAGIGSRFGVVRGYDGDPLPAPPMPTVRLKARGRRR